MSLSLQNCKAVLKILLLKLISLPGTYPICDSEIMLLRYFPTLRDSALVMIFRSHVDKEIGLQFFILCLSFPTFGIKLIQLVL